MSGLTCSAWHEDSLTCTHPDRRGAPPDCVNCPLYNGPTADRRPLPPACGPGQIASWRGDHWEVWAPADWQRLRTAAYPPITEFADAAAKMGSADPRIAAAGQTQLGAYSIACLAVKKRYPKPE